MTRKKKGRRVYPIREVNQWILKGSACHYEIDAPMDFVTTKDAPAIGKDSWWSLAHQRTRGKGLPFYRIGYKVVYVKTDLLHQLRTFRILPPRPSCQVNRPAFCRQLSAA
jgi:hypothetical protein